MSTPLLTPYALHESVYQKMKTQGVSSWGQMAGQEEIEPAHIRFLEDLLERPWAPRAGKVLEIGCGTAPLLRWFADRGFRGVGVDVSKTALQLARAASKGRPLRFVHGDLCTKDFARPGSFDLCIDGFCLHCITDPGDRAALLKRVASLLRPGGLFIVMTMCTPINRAAWGKLHSGQRFAANRIYTPCDKAMDYAHSRVIGGKPHLAIRYVASESMLLRELRTAGFRDRLVQFVRASGDESVSNLSVAATMGEG